MKRITFYLEDNDATEVRINRIRKSIKCNIAIENIEMNYLAITVVYEPKDEATVKCIVCNL
jgi:hypothetical protein